MFQKIHGVMYAVFVVMDVYNFVWELVILIYIIKKSIKNISIKFQLIILKTTGKINFTFINNFQETLFKGN